MKKKIIEILMKRDELTFTEAKDIVDETIELVNEALEDGDFAEAEDIFVSQLGLETDYMIGLF